LDRHNKNVDWIDELTRRRSCRWDDIEEDDDLVYKQATTTTRKETVDWIDEDGLSLEACRVKKNSVDRIDNNKKNKRFCRWDDNE